MLNHEQTVKYRSYVERKLTEQYKKLDDVPQKPLMESMKYSLLAGGKRLRPILTYEFCRMTCGEWKIANPFAMAVEMIHTYSLIHDDLPCMDNDDLRRGRPTNHKIFGEGIAVLAGDALLTDAFNIASTARTHRMSEAIGCLAECAGSCGMVGGQVLDIMSEHRVCTEQEVIDIQSRKTGALINAACTLGVIAGDGTEEQIAAAAGFAALLGLAFQIRDDMLDVIGNAKELGKATNADAGKNTFVRLYGLDKCEELVQKYTDAAINQLSVFEDTAYIIDLARYLTARNV